MDRALRHAQFREHASRQLAAESEGVGILVLWIWTLAWFIAECVLLGKYFSTDCDKDHLGAIVVCCTIIDGMMLFPCIFVTDVRDADGNVTRKPSCLVAIFALVSFVLCHIYYFREHCASQFDSLMLAYLVCSYLQIGLPLLWTCCAKSCLIRVLAQRRPYREDAIDGHVRLLRRMSSLSRWSPANIGGDGGAVRGLTPHELAQLPQCTYQHLPVENAAAAAAPNADHVVIDIKEEDCAICMEVLEAGARSRRLACQHVFHQECIDKWLGVHATCPQCRKVVEII